MQLCSGHADIVLSLLLQYFDAHGVEAYILPLPTNESNKSFDLVFEVARHLESFRLNRCTHIC